jgi:hypothetical protein
MAKARAAAYSDDEYEDATRFQRGRRQPKSDEPLHNEQDLGTENKERARSFWE